jgi:hypothetical protein
MSSPLIEANCNQKEYGFIMYQRNTMAEIIDIKELHEQRTTEASAEEIAIPDDPVAYQKMQEGLHPHQESPIQLQELETTYKDLPSEAFDAVSEVFTQTKSQERAFSRLGKWFRRKLKWDSTESVEAANSATFHKDYTRYGRKGESPDVPAIHVQTFPKDEFMPYEALSKALEENAPPTQVVGTNEYAYLLVRSEKMNVPPEDRSVDQISAAMRIARAGRPQQLKSKEFGKTFQDDHSPEQRMRDAEMAGFTIYRTKLVDGKIPEGGDFKQITTRSSQEPVLKSIA